MSEINRKLRKHGHTQSIILKYIQEQIEERGFPPSVREICEATGLKSTSTVHGHLKRMERAGLLQRDSMKPRAMTLLQADKPQGKEERCASRSPSWGQWPPVAHPGGGNHG